MKKIEWHTPYKNDGGQYKNPSWPANFPIPQIDTTIYVEETPMKVEAIDYYPEGSEGDTEPFIYIVLRTLR